MQKKRILITGSNGFLGQKLTDLMVASDVYDICCCSQSTNRNPKKAGYRFEQIDLSESNKLSALIEDFKPTHIIHSAAITSVEVCEQEPNKCQQINVDSVEFIASICRKKQIHLTFLSTDFVFDGKNGPYDEQAATNPCNAYGHSKLAAEKKIQEQACSYAILRTILVYGIIADPNRSNLVLWAKNKLSQGESIRVVDDQWRMPTWVDDLANACILSVEKNAEGIYHISSEQLFSILEAVYEVADFWQLDKELISSVHASEIGQAENRPQKTGFILTKAKQELGFIPTDFKTSLSHIQEQMKTLNRS